jgi:hypothetical protein
MFKTYEKTIFEFFFALSGEDFEKFTTQILEFLKKKMLKNVKNSNKVH